MSIGYCCIITPIKELRSFFVTPATAIYSQSQINKCFTKIVVVVAISRICEGHSVAGFILRTFYADIMIYDGPVTGVTCWVIDMEISIAGKGFGQLEGLSEY